MKQHPVPAWSFTIVPPAAHAFALIARFAVALVARTFVVAASVVAALIATSLATPTFAGPPEGNAAKLLASLLVQTPEPPVGLPGVTCGGFSWFVITPPVPVDPMDETTLDLSLIPFREGPTVIQMLDGTGRVAVARIRFLDGQVEGLPYDRNDWNRVIVTIRPRTQDSLVTVNGRAAAPVPFDLQCGASGGCSGFLAFGLTGEFLREGTGWADSIEILHGPPTGPAPEVLLDLSFDGTCSAPYAGQGAILISAPPSNAKPKSAAGS